MAGSNDIRQKIVLEGEKEYSSSIKEAQRNLKTLRSELKAETAELGKNATEQQKAEVKTKNLQKQIAEQEKIVKANKKALEEVREKYGDNAEAVAKYEQKLNESRAALANMKNQLDSVGDGFKEVQRDADMATVATKSVADSIGHLADVGNAVSSSIEGIFTGMLDTIRAAVGEVWTMIAETAAKANSWTDLANAYGSTAEKVQRITKGLEWSGGSFSDLMTIIQKVNWSGDKKEKVLTNALGISDENYTDKLEYTMLVLQRLKELKATNGKQYDSIIEEVFGGKQGTRVSWFIDNWDTIQDKLTEYDENSYGMTQDELSTMNDVFVELQTIEGKWDTLKEKFAAGFGTITLSIMTNVSGALDALSKYFNAEDQSERDAALKELKDNIVEAFKKIKEAILEGIQLLDDLAEELKQSDDSTARALGEVLDKIVEGLKWFAKEDNWKTVVAAFEALIGVWAVGNIVSALGNLAAFGAHIATLSGWLGLGKGGNGGGGGGGGGGSPTVAPTGGGWVTGASNWLTGAASTVSSFIIQNGLVNMIPMVGDWLTHESPFAGLLTGQESVGEFGEKVAETFSEESVEAFKDNWDANNPDANVFAQLGKNNILYWDKIQKQQADASEWILPDDATAEALANTVEEYLDLDEKHYTDEDRENAVQDWYDAWRTGADDEESAWAWLQEVFGDEWGDVYESIIRNLDKLSQLDQMNLTDIPSDWWNNPNGLTSEDVSGFRSVPGLMKAAVREGVSNIRVIMDGQTVGNLVAPYVSEQIARDMA